MENNLSVLIANENMEELDEISKKLKISQSNISRMEKKALVLLKKYYLNQRK